ncbi:hypothetical protein KIPB_006161, partial [Kipferlia bialata]
GAKRTKYARPWRMVLFVGGFANNISALQFEFMWTHPRSSVVMKNLASGKRGIADPRTVASAITVLRKMLSNPPWDKQPLFLNWTSPDMQTQYKVTPEGLPVTARPLAECVFEKGVKMPLEDTFLPKVSGRDRAHATHAPCPICSDQVSDEQLQCPQCKVVYCLACLGRWVARKGPLIPTVGSCPTCRAEIKWRDLLRNAARTAFELRTSGDVASPVVGSRPVHSQTDSESESHSGSSDSECNSDSGSGAEEAPETDVEESDPWGDIQEEGDAMPSATNHRTTNHVASAHADTDTDGSGWGGGVGRVVGGEGRIDPRGRAIGNDTNTDDGSISGRRHGGGGRQRHSSQQVVERERLGSVGAVPTGPASGYADADADAIDIDIGMDESPVFDPWDLGSDGIATERDRGAVEVSDPDTDPDSTTEYEGAAGGVRAGTPPQHPVSGTVESTVHRSPSRLRRVIGRVVEVMSPSRKRRPKSTSNENLDMIQGGGMGGGDLSNVAGQRPRPKGRHIDTPLFSPTPRAPIPVMDVDEDMDGSVSGIYGGSPSLSLSMYEGVVGHDMYDDAEGSDGGMESGTSSTDSPDRSRVGSPSPTRVRGPRRVGPGPSSPSPPRPPPTPETPVYTAQGRQGAGGGRERGRGGSSILEASPDVTLSFGD